MTAKKEGQLEAAGAYQWGPLDTRALRPTAKRAARAVGLTPEEYKAGCALQDRAPADLLSSWECEEVSTPDAYARLLLWDAGRLL